jgi:hypothetical protein
MVGVEEKLAAAAAHAVRGAGGTFGVGVGGGGGGSLHEQGFAELSHCAAQLKKEQRTLALAFHHPQLHEKVSRKTITPRCFTQCWRNKSCVSIQLTHTQKIKEKKEKGKEGEGVQFSSVSSRSPHAHSTSSTHSLERGGSTCTRSRVRCLGPVCGLRSAEDELGRG